MTVGRLSGSEAIQPQNWVLSSTPDHELLYQLCHRAGGRAAATAGVQSELERLLRYPLSQPHFGKLVTPYELRVLSTVQFLTLRGARVLSTSTPRQALLLVEDGALSAAVLDHGLNDGDSATLCERLRELCIPFVLHSGYSTLEGACSDPLLVPKPANPQVLVTTVEDLLRNHPISR